MLGRARPGLAPTATPAGKGAAGAAGTAAVPGGVRAKAHPTVTACGGTDIVVIEIAQIVP